MKKMLKFIVLILLATTLSGCFRAKYDIDFDSQKHQRLQNIKSLNKKLSSYDVRAFQGANSEELVLPNKVFFIGKSANFTDDAYEALDLIFALSSYYKNTSVSISGYFKDDYDGINKALAIERARRIMQYLWRSGIDANFVYADGKNTVLSNNEKESNVSLIDSVLINISSVSE